MNRNCITRFLILVNSNSNKVRSHRYVTLVYTGNKLSTRIASIASSNSPLGCDSSCHRSPSCTVWPSHEDDLASCSRPARPESVCHSVLAPLRAVSLLGSPCNCMVLHVGCIWIGEGLVSWVSIVGLC